MKSYFYLLFALTTALGCVTSSVLLFCGSGGLYGGSSTFVVAALLAIAGAVICVFAAPKKAKRRSLVPAPLGGLMFRLACLALSASLILATIVLGRVNVGYAVALPGLTLIRKALSLAAAAYLLVQVIIGPIKNAAICAALSALPSAALLFSAVGRYFEGVSNPRNLFVIASLFCVGAAAYGWMRISLHETLMTERCQRILICAAVVCSFAAAIAALRCCLSLGDSLAFTRALCDLVACLSVPAAAICSVDEDNDD